MKIIAKIAKWLAIGIGSLLLLSLATGWIANLVFGYELRQILRGMQARGIPLTAAELIPAPVPDAENAAPMLWEAADLITNAPADGAVRQLIVMMEDNFKKRGGSFDMAGWPADQRTAAINLLESDEAVKLLALLQTAARRPHYNNNLDYRQGPEMLLPHVSVFRSMGRLLALKAVVEAGCGRLDKALAASLLGLQLSQKLAEEPIIVTQLVRLALDRMAIGQLEHIAGAPALPELAAKDLIAELGLRQSLSWDATWRVEMAGLGLWVFGRVMQAPDAGTLLAELAASGHTPQSSRAVKMFSRTHVLGALCKKDLIFYLQAMEKIQARSAQPYYQIADQLRGDPIVGGLPKYAILSRMMLPNMESLIVKISEHRAVVELCRAGLALKLFQQQTGDYPESLDQIVPAWLAAMPLDPFSGQPPVYRKSAGGYMLYSLGPDMQDDNGARQNPGAQGQARYDIVWQIGLASIPGSAALPLLQPSRNAKILPKKQG